MRKTSVFHRKIRLVIIILVVIVAAALAIGLGVGLTKHSGSDNNTTGNIDSNGNTGSNNNLSLQSIPHNVTCKNATITTSNYWQPECGAAWQIEILNPLTNTSNNASVYDIDLFTNNASTIDDLHALNRKVICYFSAGSYENFRPDSSSFQRSDYGKPLEGWPGEYWLNVSSPNVHEIMTKRLDLAVTKGCDGVDPDNIDGYENNSGLNLTENDAISYLQFLADEAHSRNLSIGLKNGGAIVSSVIDFLQWEINEQCLQYNECDLFTPFTDSGKPVFHIEYNLSSNICDVPEFSTVYKNLNLDDFVEYCSYI